GAAGISCATAELAAGGGSGMRIRLDAVPLRDRSLGPAEILMSESQERIMAIAAPGDVERFLAICARWEVPATVIGEVTGTGRLELTWHGELVVDIAPETAADQGPGYGPPAARPARTRWRRTTRRRCRGRARVMSCARRCSACSPRPAWPPRPG